MKLVSRGDTTVADAYLSPILQPLRGRDSQRAHGVRLLFMQSNGGLTDAAGFRGKDSILSGPAGGIVGMARTAKAAGFDQGHRLRHGRHLHRRVALRGRVRARVRDARSPGCGCARRCWPSTPWPRAAARCCTSTAAGTGSGPDSAGADPGPACYRTHGPLTVTDANVLLGRIQPDHFPEVFGPHGDQPLDADDRPGEVPAAQRGRSPRPPATTAARSRSPRGSPRSRWPTWPARSRRSRSSAATT